MSGAKTNPVIEMRDVTVAAMKNPDVVVAGNVDWTVNAGDFWAIGGWHASGKSDFMMTVGGLAAPKKGSYRLFGEEMPIFDDERLARRLRLGLVFDGGQLLNRLTVAGNIALPLQYHTDDPPEKISERVAAILEATELSPWANSTPGAIGRNWRQRAGLARAIALKPEILLVDNPLSGLDLRHANWWLGFLDGLFAGHPLLDKKPVTLVVTADDLRPWKARARQFAFLRDRKFSVLGNRAQLDAVSDPLVKELLSGTAIEV